MSEKGEKIWERPWTTQEIIDNAENWTLAGDVALLNTLKSFGNTLIAKTNEVNSKLNNLTQRLDETSLRLDIVHNEFQSLRNTQFIESRVYEDDETLPSKEDKEDKTSNTTENEDEESKIKHMKLAVSKGLEVIDKYFDKVEVNVSDTEEESDYVSYVLKPKDIYIDRPLPYVIGSEEWYKKWHVGLVDSSSDSEIEEILDKYSESESESDLPIPDRSQIKGTSDTSSELDYSHKTSNRPVANSTFSDVKQDAVGSSDSDQNSLPVHTPLSNQNFAEQLAAKLGNVIDQKVDIPEPEINTRPIQKATETNKFPGIFFDEPPPLDEDDDFLPKRSQKGLFSGGSNLFDDDEDEKQTFTNVHKESDAPKVEAANSKPSLNLFDDDEVDEGFLTNSTLKEKKDKEHATKTPQVKSLFDDDDDSSDEGIFKMPSTGLNKPSYLKPTVKPTIPLFDDEPPELETKKPETLEASPKKKPAGGVSLFGNTDIFANQKIGSLLKNRLPDSSDDSDSDFGVKPKELPPKPQEKSKTIDIASTEPRETKSDTKITEKTKITPKQPSEGIIKPKVETISGNNEKTVQNSRDKKVEEEKLKETSKPKKISLFGDDENENDESKGKKTSLFDDVDDLFKEDLFSSVGIKKFTSSLFDDDDEVKDDLFNSFSPSKNETKTASFDNNIVDSKNREDGKESSNVLNVSEKSDYFSTINDKNMEDVQKLGKVEENQVMITESSSDPKGKTESSSINEEVAGDFKKTAKEREISPESTIDTAIKPKATNLFEGNIFDDEDESPKSSQPTNLKFGLFDEDSVAVDDLFSTTKSNLSLLIGQNKIDNNTSMKDTEEENRDDTNMTSRSGDSQKTTIDRPSHISLFRNSPPPDDDDWDTRSDDNDPFFSASEHNERSALFDEPVSRPSYDSSGIGIENTRIEGDVSSFHPYASSSRRLSTDIYNEQQSADSFFITKNRSEPPQLDAIEEKSHVGGSNKESRFEEDSVMEITPSGRLEDLYHGSGSSSTEEVKKSDEDQLAKDAKSFETSEFRQSNSPEDSLGVSVMGKIYDKKETSEAKDKSVPEPEKESKNKIATMKDRLENSAERGNEKLKPFSELPGKLKHNLQINVNALIPGSAPPKRKELTKSLSFESSTADEPDFTSLPITTADFRIETESLENKKPLERSSSFDNNSNEVEVLHSITKDRARIPLRRKPSTRRGRKELRKVMSVDIDQLEQKDLSVTDASGVAVSSVEDAKIDNSQREAVGGKISEQSLQSKEKPVVSDKPISSVSTENSTEPQLIDSTQVVTSEVSEAVIIKTKQSRDKSNILFDDEDHSYMGVFPTTADSKRIDSIFDSLNSDSDLFGSNMKSVNVSATKRTETSMKKSEEVTKGDETPTSKKLSTNEKDRSSSKKSDIFSIDDEDDNDDIFSNTIKKLPVKLDFKNKPLFDDDDDDDDLFGSSSLVTRASSKSEDKKSIPQKPRVTKTAVKKLENIKTEDDPLSSLLKDDTE